MGLANRMNAGIILCGGCSEDFSDIYGVSDKFKMRKDGKVDFIMVIFLDFIEYIPVDNKIRLCFILKQESGEYLIKPLADFTISLGEPKCCEGECKEGFLTCRVPIGYNLNGTDFPGSGGYSMRVYDISDIKDGEDYLDALTSERLVGATLFDVTDYDEN